MEQVTQLYFLKIPHVCSKPIFSNAAKKLATKHYTDINSKLYFLKGTHEFSYLCIRFQIKPIQRVYMTTDPK
jgi:hypothetical protein